MSRFTTGPWLAAARFDEGLLIPGRPRGRAFDLRLATDSASLESDETLLLPWNLHLDSRGAVASAQGWYVTGWGGKGAGQAVHLQGDLDNNARSLRLMRTWAARWSRTEIGGSVAPLHRLAVFVRASDTEVLHALCTVLAGREQLRGRLSDRGVVEALVERIVTSPHSPVYGGDGVRRLAMETSSAMRALGYALPIGGRPLPDQHLEPAEALLPAVMQRLRASPYAKGVDLDEGTVLAQIQQSYSSRTPWPFEPLFG